LDSLALEDGAIGCPETSVTNYSTQRKILEELHSGGSLKCHR